MRVLAHAAAILILTSGVHSVAGSDELLVDLPAFSTSSRFTGCDQRVFGILPSDHDFDRFISPISNPFYFEDPRSLTEARGIYLDNDLPASIGGGYANVWAGQFRVRVADRWSVIAPRVGYLDVQQPDDDESPTGLIKSPIGFKWNFLRDAERQSLVSGGATYFLTGSSDAGSNFGHGDFNFYLTGGQEIITRGHWLSSLGVRIPTDNDMGTQLGYWSNQWDYEVVSRWYGVFGVNWFHWFNSASVFDDNKVTGLDLLNLPAQDVAGVDVVTAMAGIRWKPTSHVECGTGIEIPLSARTDLLNRRVYADLIFRF